MHALDMAQLKDLAACPARAGRSLRLAWCVVAAVSAARPASASSSAPASAAPSPGSVPLPTCGQRHANVTSMLQGEEGLSPQHHHDDCTRSSCMGQSLQKPLSMPIFRISLWICLQSSLSVDAHAWVQNKMAQCFLLSDRPSRLQLLQEALWGGWTGRSWQGSFC